MRDLLDQVHAAVTSGHYYLSLYPALCLPGICGAMESENGWDTREKYISWYDEWVARKFPHPLGGGSALEGKECYDLRCSLLHQGTLEQRDNRYSRIIFCEPNEHHRIAHLNIIGDVLNLDVSVFIVNMLNGVVAWLPKAEQTANFRRNYPRFIQRYPNGYAGLVGIPMIA